MRHINRRQWLGTASAAGLTMGLPGFALAQSTTVKTARVTVGFPAGDMSDNIARLIGEHIRGRYAENTLVENKPGAAARMAITSYVKYKADGSEVLFTPGAMVDLFPHVFEKLAYDPLKELTPVTKIANAVFGLAVGPGVPAEVKTLAQYLAWCKQGARNATYATSGAGSGIHLSAEYLAKLSNTPLTMVPYRGASPAATDLIAGQIPAQMATIPSLIEFVRAGKARFIAVTSPERLPGFPDVPTFKEAGYPQLVTDDWFGFFLPAGAAPGTVSALDQAIQAAIKDPKVTAALEHMGLTVAPTASPAAFSQLIAEKYAKWREITKQIQFNPLA